mmetsp:Transcript_18522/g.41960  ORF Transcript_18522/g.41960 Transcript_18522/m.41960 type:complete len:312 (+) Transcript_18522:144-1079(+)
MIPQVWGGLPELVPLPAISRDRMPHPALPRGAVRAQVLGRRIQTVRGKQRRLPLELGLLQLLTVLVEARGGVVVALQLRQGLGPREVRPRVLVLRRPARVLKVVLDPVWIGCRQVLVPLGPRRCAFRGSKAGRQKALGCRGRTRYPLLLLRGSFEDAVVVALGLLRRHPRAAGTSAGWVQPLLPGHVLVPVPRPPLLHLHAGRAVQGAPQAGTTKVWIVVWNGSVLVEDRVGRRLQPVDVVNPRDPPAASPVEQAPLLLKLGFGRDVPEIEPEDLPKLILIDVVVSVDVEEREDHVGRELRQVRLAQTEEE